MSKGWSVILEREVVGMTEPTAAGRSLLYYQRQIDELAEKLGVSPLSGFFSRDPNEILEYLRREGFEPDPDQIPEEEWFEAGEGLATVVGLLSQLRSDAMGLPEPTKIIADLEQVERALALAVQNAVRFHLGRELPESISEMRQPE